jgi:hypothetical protein
VGIARALAERGVGVDLVGLDGHARLQ